jgi:RNA polymerase sigma-70 factor (ECF subfamily)
MNRYRRDKELVRLMLAGDENAFEEFSDHHIPALYRYASRRLAGDRELTREIVQGTLCKAIGKLSTFRGEAALTTWLCACCRNEIAAHFRRRHWMPREVDVQEVEETAAAELNEARPEGPEDEYLRKEAGDVVHQALDALPAHYGKALEWKYIESLPVKEIAHRLDLGLKAAESLLTRARKAFREEYERLVVPMPASSDAVRPAAL